MRISFLPAQVCQHDAQVFAGAVACSYDETFDVLYHNIWYNTIIMNIPPSFRAQYDLCLTDQLSFDGCDMSICEYRDLRLEPEVVLRSDLQMRVGEFILAHGAAAEDIQSSFTSLPMKSDTYAQFLWRRESQLRGIQVQAGYSWAEFFSVYLHEEFRKFVDEDVSWRDATDLTPRQIFQAKRAKLESVKSRDRVAQAAKCAAYLTIAALAHGDEPATS